MKIEKVNDNQIRCTLSKKDLADRQIKLSELAYGSEKAKGLFRDMIEQANYEFGFEADDIPLMIEAIPLSGENIILQITKVEYPEELDTRFSKFSEADEEEEEITGESSILPELQGEKLDVISNLTKLFEFKNLEQLERLAQVLGGFYEGKNDLYKDERKSRLYLLVQKSSHTPEEFNKVCNVISEYAIHRKYVPAKEAFLKEHGKLLVKGNALQMLESIG
ncbi:MAG: adaptor protein MecA [Agathobacter sp.]|nr:adaptor protein MecA [Agathobacter sp.]